MEEAAAEEDCEETDLGVVASLLCCKRLLVIEVMVTAPLLPKVSFFMRTRGRPEAGGGGATFAFTPLLRTGESSSSSKEVYTGGEEVMSSVSLRVTLFLLMACSPGTKTLEGGILEDFFFLALSLTDVD